MESKIETKIDEEICDRPKYYVDPQPRNLSYLEESGCAREIDLISIDGDEKDDSIWNDYHSELADNHTRARVIKQTDMQRKMIITLACSFALANMILLALNLTSEDSQNSKMEIAVIKPSIALLDLRCKKKFMNTKQGWDECESICNSAECCHMPVNTEGSCLESATDECKIFSKTCKYLFDIVDYVKDSSMRVHPAPPNITNLCMYSDIYIYTECEDQCIHAECCVAQLLEDNCFRNNMDTCVGYASCTKLLDPDPKIAKTACTFDNLMTKSGIEACRSACSPAMCCFPTIFGITDANCMSSSICEEFAACEVLPSTPAGILTTSHDHTFLITEMCTKKAVATDDGYRICHKLCRGGECCYQDTLSTEDCALQTCTQYEPCKVLNDFTKTENIQNYSIGEYNNLSQNDDLPFDLVEAATIINTTCMFHSLITQEGSTQCKSVCGRIVEDCCMLEKHDCDRQKPDIVCEAFINCENLVAVHPQYKIDVEGGENIDSGNNLDPVFLHVKRTCAVDSIKTASGNNACRRICYGTDCCFSADDCASDSGFLSSECAIYSPCHALLNDTSMNEPGTGLVIDNGSVEPVASHSQPSSQPSDGLSIGSQDEEYPGSSIVTQFDPGDDVEAHSGHGEEHSGSNNEEQPGSGSKSVVNLKYFFDTICSESHVKSTGGHEMCAKECKTHLCCISGECILENQQNCEQFSACRNIYSPLFTDETNSASDNEAQPEPVDGAQSTPKEEPQPTSDEESQFGSFDETKTESSDETLSGSGNQAQFGFREHEQSDTVVSLKHFYDTICSSDHVESVKGFEMCAHECESYLCCITEVVEGQCSEVNQHKCDQFSACQNIMD